MALLTFTSLNASLPMGLVPLHGHSPAHITASSQGALLGQPRTHHYKYACHC